MTFMGLDFVVTKPDFVATKSRTNAELKEMTAEL